MTENEIFNYLEAYGLRARNAAAVLAVAPAGVKNAALSNAAELLVRNTERILIENQNDVEAAAAKGMSVRGRTACGLRLQGSKPWRRASFSLQPWRIRSERS